MYLYYIEKELTMTGIFIYSLILIQIKNATFLTLFNAFFFL